MSVQGSVFWERFNHQDFSSAQKELDALPDGEKQAVLAELFQKSSHQHTPLIVSVLRRKPHEGQAFDDFYQSWLPGEGACDKIEKRGESFQQFFPAPVRVLNGENVDGSGDIISIGLVWARNKEEEQGVWEYLKSANAGEDADNKARRENIKETSEAELVGVYKVKADDNLGTPY